MLTVSHGSNLLHVLRFEVAYRRLDSLSTADKVIEVIEISKLWEYFMGGKVFAVEDSKASNGSVLKLYAFSTK